VGENLGTIGVDRRPETAQAVHRRTRPPVPVDVGAQWRRLLRRWPTVVGTWLLVLAATVAAGLLWTPTYQATAALTVTPAAVNPLSGGSGAEEVQIHTEEATLSSRRVAVRAAALLQGVEPPEADPALVQELLESTETATPSQTDVLRVTAFAPDPDRAVARANALAEAYLDDRAESVTAAAKEARERLDESIAALKKDDSESYALRELRAQRAGLSLVSPTPGQIISPAVSPDSPTSAGLLVFVAGGLVGGLLLGLVAGALRERFDRRVRSAERLAQATSHPVAVLTSETDEDGALEVLRMLVQDGADSVPAPGARIAVHAVEEGHAEIAVNALRTVLSSWGVSVRLVDLETFMDRTYPLQDSSEWIALATGASPTVLVSVVPPQSSVSQLAAMADRSDGLVIVVEARSALARCRRLVDRATGRNAVVVPTFVPRHRAPAAHSPAKGH
jgi:capsular polysaccharide biosynthesis protein